MPTEPRNWVPAPLAAPPRVGLIASARLVEQEEREWVLGFSFEPEACSGAVVYDPCLSGADLSSGVTDPPANRAIRDFSPYTVRAFDKCSTFGYAARDWEGRATRALNAQQSFQMEKELWTATLSRARSWGNPFLASMVSDVITAGATSVTDALSCLDGASRDCNSGQRTMIHATRQVVNLWEGEHLLRHEGGLTLTANDNIVVSGAGYDGSGPPGIIGGAPTPATNGHVWAYATDIVDIRQGAIRIFGGPTPQGVNRSTNTFVTVAERTVAATWSGCCLLAAEISVSLCDTGDS